MAARITDPFRGIPVLGRRTSRRDRPSGVRRHREPVWKRMLDLVLAAGLLLLLLPLIVTLAIAVKLDSAGPVFYRARRVGRHGRSS